MVNQEIKSVLYVDDEEPNLILFEAIFERKYSVVTASSGEEALSKLQGSDGEIAIVISDLSMPKMNGLEFIRKAKEQYRDIGYFILTGYGSSEEIDQALKEKLIFRFFTKPFKEEEIYEAIEDFKDSIAS